MKNPSFPYNHLGVLGLDRLKKFLPKFKDRTLQAEIENTFSPEDLAPLVEIIASKIAEDINSSGIKEQLKFIEQNGWKQEEIIQYVLEDD
jgi:hypothetical protein